MLERVREDAEADPEDARGDGAPAGRGLPRVTAQIPARDREDPEQERDHGRAAVERRDRAPERDHPEHDPDDRDRVARAEGARAERQAGGVVVTRPPPRARRLSRTFLRAFQTRG